MNIQKHVLQLVDDFNVESSIYMRAHSDEEEILKGADCERSQKTYPSQVKELILWGGNYKEDHQDSLDQGTHVALGNR